MSRRALFLVSGVAVSLGAWACSSQSVDKAATNNDGTDPALDGGAGAVAPGTDAASSTDPGAGGGGGGGGSTDGGAAQDAGSDPAGSPLANHGPLVEVAPNTEAPGGYFDSVRQWYDAGLMFTDPWSGGGGGILFQYANGAAQPFRMPSNVSLGSAIDKNRALVTAESNVAGTNTGRIVRTLPSGAQSTVAAAWIAGGVNVPFDSPNDLTVRKSDNTIYFTDPGYQNPDAGINHVFRIDPGGAAKVVDSCDTLCRPNGIALSPDEKTLYVGFTGPFWDGTVPYIGKYPVNADGSLGAVAKLADVGADLDGLATDDAGNVYAAYAGGVVVFDPSGKKWGVLTLPKQPTAVAFGDADRKTLYVAANSAAGPSVYTVKLAVAGRVE